MTRPPQQAVTRVVAGALPMSTARRAPGMEAVGLAAQRRRG
ncbi:hypothetical protein [Nonomuraea turkmeniaca]|nr:hypothetical protein [Nonomuraea turkmeniaca]